MRTLFILLTLLAAPSVASAQAIWGNRTYSGPVCGNPNCQMCYGPSGIAAQLAAQRDSQRAASVVLTSASVTTQQPTTVEEYESVQVPVVQRVKRCDGVRCWYENVTTFRTERRPVVRTAVPTDADRSRLLTHTDLVPTPHEAVSEMIQLANPAPDEVLYDIGCGDGRVLIAAAFWHGCHCVGIELNPQTADLARANIRAAEPSPLALLATLPKGEYRTGSVADLLRVYQGNALEFEYPQADVVTMYLYPVLMEKLLPKFKRGTRVVSYLHPIPGGERVVRNGHVFYIWTKP